MILSKPIYGSTLYEREKESCMLRPALVAAAFCFSFSPWLMSNKLSAATFQPLGERTEAYDVSADGYVVVGVSYGEAFRGEAFRWTESSGLVGLGFLPGGREDQSRAFGVSADGSVIVGDSWGEDGIEAFRWTSSDEGMVGLGDLPGGNFYSDARAVSADGSVIVGAGFSSEGATAYRWTQVDGIVPIGGSRTYGEGVSGDGSVVVGDAGHPTVGVTAFRWTNDKEMVSLGEGIAKSASADGSVVVGAKQSPPYPDGEPFRWTEATGMVGLGFLPGGVLGQALDVSADGSVIVGFSGNPRLRAEAFVWTAVHGMLSVEELLSGAGVDMTGWKLNWANGVSADGRVIVGVGENPNGVTEAWLAQLDVVGDFNANGVLDPEDIDMLAGDQPDPSLDLTGDGMVNRDDRVYWVHELAGSWFGDTNLDGEFNSSDLVAVFEAGKYNRDVVASWSEGDWNGDGRFGTADLVTAFEDGGYTAAAMPSIPEPRSAAMLLAGLIGIAIRRRSVVA